MVLPRTVDPWRKKPNCWRAITRPGIRFFSKVVSCDPWLGLRLSLEAMRDRTYRAEALTARGIKTRTRRRYLESSHDHAGDAAIVYRSQVKEGQTPSNRHP
jgi:hypothetical protein